MDGETDVPRRVILYLAVIGGLLGSFLRVYTHTEDRTFTGFRPYCLEPLLWTESVRKVKNYSRWVNVTLIFYPVNKIPTLPLTTVGLLLVWTRESRDTTETERCDARNDDDKGGEQGHRGTSAKG